MVFNRSKLHSVHKLTHKGTFTEEQILNKFDGMSGLKLAVDHGEKKEKADFKISDHDMKYAPFYLSLFYSTAPESLSHPDVDKDMNKAVSLLEKHADKLCPSLKNYLGTLYDEGSTYQITDMAKALQYYKEAAEQSYLKAMLNLGELYFTGVHGILERDFEKAEGYFKDIINSCLYTNLVPRAEEVLSLYTVNCANLNMWYMYSSQENPHGKIYKNIANVYLKAAAIQGHEEACQVVKERYKCLPTELEVKLQETGDLTNDTFKEEMNTSTWYQQYSCTDEDHEDCQKRHTHDFIDKDVLMEHSVFSKTAEFCLSAFNTFKAGVDILKDSNYDGSGLQHLVNSAFHHKETYERSWFLLLATLGEDGCIKFGDCVSRESQKGNPDAIFLKHDQVPVCCPHKDYNGDEKHSSHEECEVDTWKQAIARIQACECIDPTRKKRLIGYFSFKLVDYFISKKNLDQARAYLKQSTSVGIADTHTILNCYMMGYFSFKLTDYFISKNHLEHARAYLKQAAGRGVQDTHTILHCVMYEVEKTYTKHKNNGAYMCQNKESLARHIKTSTRAECVLSVTPDSPHYYKLLYYKSMLNYLTGGEWKTAFQHAQEHENNALPFLTKGDCEAKDFLMTKLLACSYCSKLEPLHKDLLLCPCHSVQYCGKVCQKLHWSHHRKSCAHKNPTTKDNQTTQPSPCMLNGVKKDESRKPLTASGTNMKKQKGSTSLAGQNSVNGSTKHQHKLNVSNIKKSKADKVKNHKSQMMNRRKTQEIKKNVVKIGSITSEFKCIFCKQSLKTPKFCPCSEAMYCSLQCKMQDWHQHKSVCTYVYVCSYCSKKAVTGVKLQGCPCGAVSYCNETCKNKHWHQHQLTCALHTTPPASNSPLADVD